MCDEQELRFGYSPKAYLNLIPPSDLRVIRGSRLGKSATKVQSMGLSATFQRAGDLFCQTGAQVLATVEARFGGQSRIDQVLDSGKQSIDSGAITYPQVLHAIGVGFDPVTCALRQGLLPEQLKTLGACLLADGERFLGRLKSDIGAEPVEILAKKLQSLGVNFTDLALRDSFRRFSIPGGMEVIGKVEALDGNVLETLLPNGTPITAGGVGNSRIVGRATRPVLVEWLRDCNPTLFRIDGQSLPEFLASFRVPYTVASDEWSKTGGRFDPCWGQLNGTNIIPLMAMHEVAHRRQTEGGGAAETKGADLAAGSPRTDILGVRDGESAVMLLLQALALDIKGLQLNLVDCAFDPLLVENFRQKINSSLKPEGEGRFLIVVNEYQELQRQVELDVVNKSFQTRTPHYTGCGLFIYLQEHPEVVRQLVDLGVVINIHPASTDAFFDAVSKEEIYGSYFAFVDGGHSGPCVVADLDHCGQVEVAEGGIRIIAADDYKANYFAEFGSNGDVGGAVDAQIGRYSLVAPGPERGCDLVVLTTGRGPTIVTEAA